MFVRRYAFEKGQPKNLEISWKYNWKLEKIFTIQLDGEVINPIENKYNRRNGWEFILQDGSRLKVKLSRFSRQLEVYRNGEPLLGSATDPSHQLAEAYQIIFMCSALLIIAGSLRVLSGGINAKEFSNVLSSIIIGAIFLILGFFVRMKSLVALIITMLAFALLGLQSEYHLIKGLIFRTPINIPLSLFSLIIMFPGIKAIQKLKKTPST